MNLSISWLRALFSPDHSNRDLAPAINVWRSMFGASLRKESCTTGAPQCGGCPQTSQCSYLLLFESPVPEGADWMAGGSHLPHPMLLRSGDNASLGTATVEIILFGHARAHAGQVISALSAAGLAGLGRQRKIYRLRTVECFQSQEGGWQPWQAADAAPPAMLPIVPPLPAQPIVIRLLTPTHLRQRGQDIRPDRFTFDAWFGNLLRRLFTIARYYGEGWPISVESIHDLQAEARTVRCTPQNLQWVSTNRYSARQRRETPLVGIIGLLRLDEVPAPLWKILWYGQWVHSGRATMFGQGQYRIEMESASLPPPFDELI